jgi:integration host factor subunit beta
MNADLKVTALNVQDVTRALCGLLIQPTTVSCSPGLIHRRRSRLRKDGNNPQTSSHYLLLIALHGCRLQEPGRRMSPIGCSSIKNSLAAKGHLLQREVAKLVAVTDEIELALARGKRVELRGFGSFTLKRRRGRVARNPKSGAPVQVSEKFFVLFRPGFEIRKRINRAES